MLIQTKINVLELILRQRSACLLRYFLQEFEDNFDDEIDFTPPAEDTPSVQSPAEVFTLSVPNIALPAPSQFPSRPGKILVFNEKPEAGNFSVKNGV